MYMHDVCIYIIISSLVVSICFSVLNVHVLVHCPICLLQMAQVVGKQTWESDPLCTDACLTCLKPKRPKLFAQKPQTQGPTAALLPSATHPCSVAPASTLLCKAVCQPDTDIEKFSPESRNDEQWCWQCCHPILQIAAQSIPTPLKTSVSHTCKSIIWSHPHEWRFWADIAGRL